MRKRLSCVILSALLLLSVPLGAAAEPFADTEGHWARQQISRWAERHIVEGFDGYFRPDDLITRGEAATIIDRLMRYPRRDPEDTFTDLREGWFSTEPVLKLSHAGVMNGYPDGTALPEANASRQEVAVMLARAFRIPVSEASMGVSLTYPDNHRIAQYAFDTVRAFTALGYLHGDEMGNLRPTDPITRAEFLTLLDNIVKTVLPTDGKAADAENGLLLLNEPELTVSDEAADTMFVAPGVGEGTVSFENVSAERMEVLGGGMHSVIIRGDSRVRSIQIAKQDSGVRVLVLGNSSVEVTRIEDGCSDVILSGSFQTVAIDSSANNIRLEDASVNNLTVTGSGVQIFIDADSTVKALSIAQSAEQVEVVCEGEISTVNVHSPTATVRYAQEAEEESETGTDTGSDSGTGSGSSSGSGGGTRPAAPEETQKPEEPENPVVDPVDPDASGYPLVILKNGNGIVFAEELPDPEKPDNPVVDPVNPEIYGYPVVFISEGNGIIVAEEVQPEPEPDPDEYVAHIEIVGKGTVIIEDRGV